MTYSNCRVYFRDIGRALTHKDVGKVIIRTLPFNGNDFFMVPKLENPTSAQIILHAIDLNGIVCKYSTGDIFRIDGQDAFEKAYLTLQEFLLLQKSAGKLVNGKQRNYLEVNI